MDAKDALSAAVDLVFQYAVADSGRPCTRGGPMCIPGSCMSSGITVCELSGPVAASNMVRPLDVLSAVWDCVSAVGSGLQSTAGPRSVRPALRAYDIYRQNCTLE